jgi:hypothetical protein
MNDDARNHEREDFGILYSKWRIISKARETEVELAEKNVKCICVSHDIIIVAHDGLDQMTN